MFLAMSSHIILVQLLLKVLPDENHLVGSVACARTICGHMNRAWDGEQRSLEKSLKDTKCPTTPPKFEHDLGCVCLGNECTQCFLWPQKAPQACFQSHRCSHQQGGFRRTLPEGILSLNIKSTLSSSKQCSYSAGCPTQKDSMLSGHKVNGLFL